MQNNKVKWQKYYVENHVVSPNKTKQNKTVDLILKNHNNKFTFLLSFLGRTTLFRWQNGSPTLIMAAARACHLWSSTPISTTSMVSSGPAAPWRWARWLQRTSPCWPTTAGTGRRTWWTRGIWCTGSRLSYDLIASAKTSVNGFVEGAREMVSG